MSKKDVTARQLMAVSESVLAKDWNTPEEDKAWEYLSDRKLETEADLVLGTKEVVVEQPAPKTYNSSSVKLQSQMDAHLQYIGQATGEQYEWKRAGSIVEVDSKDALYLLSKRIKTQSCCSQSDIVVFQKID